MIDPAWDEAHRRGWGTWPNTRVVEWVMRRYGGVPDRRAVSFLELGCGAGAQTAFLAAEGFTVTGVDGSTEAIATARQLRRTGQDGLSATYLAADLVSWRPERMAEYDCILDVCTLQHLTQTDANGVALRAVRWLKPGGVLFSMFAMSGDAVRDGVPAPRYARKGQIGRIFSSYRLQYGSEAVSTSAGRRAHWLIEATPRS
jgi:SAM-dependent methyltransferase